jgi:3-phosphoshikimate 1-carboxyvinyltransferase
LQKALASNETVINVGAAGTAMRFLTAYYACTPCEHILTGSERMCKRPIGILVNALRQLGADIEYMGEEGFPPLKIKGKTIEGGEITINGTVSSQYSSALLMVAPMMKQGLVLHVEDAISAPYINMTIALMADFGVNVIEVSDETLLVEPVKYRPRPFEVEPDWSAASYWYSLLAVAGKGEVLLPGMREWSLQGDSAVSIMFERLGVSTAFMRTGAVLTASSQINRSKYYEDFFDIPDLAQTFTVACCLLNMPYCFDGIGSLEIKETDRTQALTNELKTIGYDTEYSDGVIEWDGAFFPVSKRPMIHTYDDHRMAMAFAAASYAFPNGLIIENPDVVSKSYPNFWNDLRSANFFLSYEL